MIMPSGHARTLRTPRHFSAREKWVLLIVSGTLAALVVALVVSFSSTGHVSGNGCVDASLPYTTGATEVYRCGEAARSLCRSVGVPSGYTGEAGRTIAVECRKAGLPVG